MAVQQRAARASKTQVAVRSGAAFAAIVLTMSIWWPAGIGVALIACVAATVLANRMLQAADRGEAADADAAALLAAFGPEEALRA